MLLAMLNAKSAEDQVRHSNSIISHFQLTYHLSHSARHPLPLSTAPSSRCTSRTSPPQSQSPPQAHLQHIASAAATPPFTHPHLPPPPQQPQYASAHTAQSQSPQLFAHSPELERVHSHSVGSSGGGGGSPRITLPAIREQRAILPATSSRGVNGVPPSSRDSTSSSKRKRARLSPGPAPPASYAPSSSSRRAYGPPTSIPTTGAGAGNVPPSPTPSSSRSHTTSRRSLSPEHEHDRDSVSDGHNHHRRGSAMAIGSLLSSHSSGSSNGSGRRRRISQRDEDFEDDLVDADELDADMGAVNGTSPGWSALSRPTSGSDRERDRYHHTQHAHPPSHRTTPKSRTSTVGSANGRARPLASRPSD